MTHAVAGFPNLAESADVVRMMSGVADFIEIQIPFSDPVADGPTMMSANEQSLENGFRVEHAFEMAKALITEVSTPILFMTYYNIVFCRGVARFCREAAAVGISGLIIPDMPVEEEFSEHFFAECEHNGLAPILVVSPITPEERIQKLAQYARGFWYAVSRTGTTGIRDEFDSGDIVEKIRKYSNLPIALAFGISRPEHLTQVAKKAEMAVVGSATMQYFFQKNSFSENLRAAEIFLKNLRK